MEKTESRLYIAAFLIVGMITMMSCSYGYGCTAEMVRESNETDQAIDDAIAQRDYWQSKYNFLANDSDALTIIDAEAKYQQEARNGR